MRREELLIAFNRITSDIEKTGISNLVNDVLTSFHDPTHGPINMKSDNESINILKIHFGWQTAYNAYGTVETEVFKALDLEELNNYEIWGILMGFSTQIRSENQDISDSEHFGHILGLDQKLRQLRQVIKPITALLDRKSKLGSESEDGVLPSYLSVRLIEDEGEFTTAIRVVQVVESIQKIYDAFQKFENTSDSPLSVAYLDSGSDKSFDFTGATSIINFIKEFLLDIYDRYSQHKKVQAENFIDIAKGSIEIFDQINVRVKEGKLPQDAAKIIEIGLIEGMQSFLSVGAITSEIEQSEITSPRMIMKQEVKLLTSSSEVEKISKPKPKARARKKQTAIKKK